MILAAALVVCCAGRGTVGSILSFVPRVVFDDSDTRVMGEAFDAACEEVDDTGSRLWCAKSWRKGSLMPLLQASET